MNTETTALTNFTASKTKVDGLFAKKKITLKDIEDLTQTERDYLTETTTQTLATLKGEERDNFLDKIDLIIPAGTKSNVWEYNHLVITEAISRFMRHHGIMPTKSAIAEETGLSRQTINKHFAAYKAQPEFTAQIEQFKFMAPKMLANVFKYASSGDMKAARLYFEMVGAINKKQNTVVNEQNNYIQINNTILSQENLKTLTAEQLNQIESIINVNQESGY
ncbi:MAG: hypothetical protein ACHQIM_16630 [Sphingobacteriales bacterium]